MKPPLDGNALRELLVEVVGRNRRMGIKDDLLIDVIFSGGLVGNKMLQSDEGAYLYVAVQKMEPPPAEFYEKGICLATFPHLRICPDVKLLHYVGAILAHQTVVPTYGAQDVLFLHPHDQQTILEGSTFTIFFVNSDREILTPPLDGSILDSITRRVLLELLGTSDTFKVHERPVLLTQIQSFAESFIASTTRNVVPVTRINNAIIGNGRPGVVTQSVMNTLQSYIASY